MAGALGAVLSLFVLLTIGLVRLAGWAERNAASYPWRSEDYLRYLRPTFDGRGDRTILIAGPSEAREDLFAESFTGAFPWLYTVQGGLTLGTFDDLLVGLEYWDTVFGEDAIPRVLVLAITPRFVANIPRGESPLLRAIDRYSPHYSVVASDAGSVLVEKTAWEGLRSRGRFLGKQPKRYQAAVCSAVLRGLGAWTAAGRTRDRRRAEPSRPAAPRLIEALDRCRSPYKYHHSRPIDPARIEVWLTDSSSFWFATHNWDPGADAALIRSQFERLGAIARRADMHVFLVNLPEHPANRALYRPSAYARYLELVREAAAPAPLLDLRELLPASEFYDAGHATRYGAQLVTDTTVRFLRHADPLLYTHLAGGAAFAAAARARLQLPPTAAPGPLK